jgi:membrane protease YdiL (CAAX protease family)
MNNPHPPGTQIREVIALLLTLLTLGAIVARAWGYLPSDDTHSQLENTSQVKTSQVGNFNERLFDIQAKFMVGAVNYYKNNVSNSTQLNNLLKGFEEQFLNVNLEQSKKSDTRVLQKQLALAIYLDLNPLADKLSNFLEYDSTSSSYTLRKAREQLNANTLLLTEPELNQLTSDLGWYGELISLKLNGSDSKSSSSITDIQKSFEVLLRAIAIVSVLFTVSIFLFLVYCYLFSKGKQTFSFQQSTVPSYLLLEIFLLYLAAMHFLPDLADFLFAAEQRSNYILLNIVAISSLISLLFWPTIFKIKISAIADTLGLKITDIKQLILSVVYGLVGYLTAIAPLILVLFGYSAILSLLKVSPLQGTHPIIPIMLSDNSSNFQIQILILAVVVAPIIEELMFRGVLFSWFRLRFGATFTIITSGLIFAAIHPQGAIGLVPLGFIGIALGFLREWRNSIIASMVAHACFNFGTLMLVNALLT